MENTSHTKNRTTPARRAVALVGVLSIALGLVLAMTSSSVSAAPMTGAIFTTDSTCTGVDLNIYSDKGDVYLDGGPQHHPGAAGLPDGKYYVQVTEPNGDLLGTSVGTSDETPVVVSNGEFADCYQLAAILVQASDGKPGYDDTTNPGGEYKVWVSQSSDFANPDSKTDNFKVKGGGGTEDHRITADPPTLHEDTSCYGDDWVSVPELANIWYHLDGETTDLSGTNVPVPPGTSVTIIAEAANGYTLVGDHEWTLGPGSNHLVCGEIIIPTTVPTPTTTTTTTTIAPTTTTAPAEVLPFTEEQTTTTMAPTPTTVTELAFTGSGTRTMALVAVGLITMGGFLVIGSTLGRKPTED